MFDDNLFLNSPRSTIEMPAFLFDPGIFDTLSPSDRLFLGQRNRAVMIWNQRAALLKAVDNGLQGVAHSDATDKIASINNWFANQLYNSNIDEVTGRAVTPLIDGDRLKMLAEQNNRAAQDIAVTNVAADLVRLGTDLANIASRNIGGPVGSG